MLMVNHQERKVNGLSDYIIVIMLGVSLFSQEHGFPGYCVFPSLLSPRTNSSPGSVMSTGEVGFTWCHGMVLE